MKAITPEPTLAGQVYESIRKSIISGQLAPGSLHSVKSLADSLEVSRTPVREALIDLAAVDMVRFERNRGVRILETQLPDLVEIFVIRLLAEPPMAYRATECMTESGKREIERSFKAMESAASAGNEPLMMEHDRRFHVLLVEQAGNERLARYMDQLRDLILSRGVSTVGKSRSLSDVVDAHRRILCALVAGDAAGAAEAMRDHVLQTAEMIVTQEHQGDPAELRRWAQLSAVPIPKP
ncbi:MAG: GntR family transcriptional regulator [Acidimicrobiia bacterium]|nr:GntR family transcriptional regulator [Acidimicrobiia bacterium]